MGTLSSSVNNFNPCAQTSQNYAMVHTTRAGSFPGLLSEDDTRQRGDQSVRYLFACPTSRSTVPLA